MASARSLSISLRSNAEFMYASVTLNDAKHAQAILGVMDNELVTGTKTKLMVEGVGVLVLLKCSSWRGANTLRRWHAPIRTLHRAL